MSFKTKADKCFDNQLSQVLTDFDFEACEKLFFRYGCYLELIDPDLQLTRSEVRTRMEAQ